MTSKTEQEAMRPHRQRQPTYGTIIDNARDSSVASRVSFSDHRSEHSAVPMPSPSIHDEDAQDQGSDYFTYSYAPSYETFRQRIRLGALSSLALLLTILLLFAYFVEATTLSVPVILGLAAYLSSDAIRTHFIFTLLESDTAILVFHALLQECLRLPATLFALNAAPGPDILVLSQVAAVAFGVAWGMAFAESALRAWNLWQQTSLYVDVLLSEEPSKSTPSPRSLEEQEDVSTFLRSDHPSSSSPLPQDEESAFIDNIFDAKSRERARLDLEDLLGMPLFVVPSFLLPLWSLNSFLLSLAQTLVIASIPTALPTDLILALSITSILRTALAFVWARGTSRFGLAAISYACLLFYSALCLVALGAFGVIR